jgi:hypothetical protein
MIFDVSFRDAADRQFRSQLEYDEQQRRKSMTPEELRAEEEREREIEQLNERLNRQQEQERAAVAAAEERTRAERVRLAQARERVQSLIERRGLQVELLRFAPDLEFRHDPRLWPRVTEEQIDVAKAELEGLEKAEKANAPQPPSIPAEEKAARPVYTARQRKPGVCSVCDQWVPDTTTPWHKGALPGDICIVDPIGALRSGIVTREQLINLGLIKE